MFGTLGGMFVPIAFAAVTIPTTLGFVWIFAHMMDMAIYVTNIVALIPIIEMAGGRVTTWDGKPATDGGRIIAAGDPRLHEQAMEILSR